MTATYVHRGDTIDYTPGAAVNAGDVIVQGELVGVAKRDIPANVLGSIDVEGVFDIAKATGGGSAIGVGVDVFWDEAASQATADSAAGANKKLGRSVKAADDDATTVRVRLSQ